MLDPNEKQLILDPACGTGGFLITAMNQVIEKIRAAEMAKWANNLTRAEQAVKARIKKFAEQFIAGMDFNPSW
jgi:type I restriction enzyme M protein